MLRAVFLECACSKLLQLKTLVDGEMLDASP